MQLHCHNLPWSLDKRLVGILNDCVKSVNPENGVILSFRDPDFSPESGGFHPVEFSINREGELQYITDFSYVGSPPMCDLVKALDFSFSDNTVESYGLERPLSEGRELFQLFESNFIAYHEMNAYTVEIESW